MEEERLSQTSDTGSSQGLEASDDDDIVTTLNGKKKRKLTSDVHAHYEEKLIDGVTYFYCKYCRQNYQKKGGVTSTMKRHTNKSHPSKVKGEEDPNTISRFLINKDGDLPVPACNDQNFRKSLVNFILLSDQPFSLVEEKSFRDLVRLLKPEISVPSRATIRSDIIDLFNKEKSQLKNDLLKLPGKLSFIIDGWTSSNQRSFIGVIVQGITENWQIFTIPLDFVILEGHHSGENIARCFMDVLEEYELHPKLHSITTDNASNMDTFFGELKLLLAGGAEKINFDVKNFRIRCLAHIMNLCCQAAILFLQNGIQFSDNELDDLELESDATDKTHPILVKLRNGIRFIRGSPQRREQFRLQCTAFKNKQKELILDVITRWNSTFDMMERALELQKALDSTLRLDKKSLRWILKEEEWSMIGEMMNFLKPFKSMTVLMSKQSYPTVSFCALVYSQLFKHLEMYKIDAKRKLTGKDPRTGVEFPEWIRTAADAAYEKLDKYYPTSDGLVYIVATFLDPRCKFEWFGLAGFNKETITKYKRAIQSCWDLNYKPSTISTESVATQDQDGEFDLFMQLNAKKSKSDKKDDLERFIAEPTVRPELITDGSLGWWKNHCSDYPYLAKMAQDLLSACGTGVPVESLFSAGPDIISHRRQSMNPETIQQLILLKGWLKAKSQGEFCNMLCKAAAEKMLGGVAF